jgi:lipoate-protein ligase A
MAVDEALLERAIQGSSHSAVLRVYRWARPALSIGINQTLNGGIAERCGQRGVEVVRRITGGGAVYHKQDVTYCVVAPRGQMGVLEAYRWVADGLIAGFLALGLKAKVGEHVRRQGDRTRGAGRRQLSACFATTLGADLEVGGFKVCGSAQVRRREWFLQHGSIPIIDVRSETRWLLGHSDEDHSTCLERLRPGITWEEVADSLVLGFTRSWGESPQLFDVDSYLNRAAVQAELA